MEKKAVFDSIMFDLHLSSTKAIFDSMLAVCVAMYSFLSRLAPQRRRETLRSTTKVAPRKTCFWNGNSARQALTGTLAAKKGTKKLMPKKNDLKIQSYLFSGNVEDGKTGTSR